MYKYLIKPIMFLLDPEKAHHITVKMLTIVLAIPGIQWIFRMLYRVDAPELHRNIWGIHFPNPVGLAAGFDKDGKCFEQMSSLGFGFIEIGTVTPWPSPEMTNPGYLDCPKTMH